MFKSLFYYGVIEKKDDELQLLCHIFIFILMVLQKKTTTTVQICHLLIFQNI
jgi:hypothetical protein